MNHSPGSHSTSFCARRPDRLAALDADTTVRPGNAGARSLAIFAQRLVVGHGCPRARLGRRGDPCAGQLLAGALEAAGQFGLREPAVRRLLRAVRFQSMNAAAARPWVIMALIFVLGRYHRLAADDRAGSAF